MKRLLIILALSIFAHADSIPFVVQNNGQTMVSLSGNPTVGPSYDLAYCVYHLGGPYLEFSMIPLSSGSGTLSLTINGTTQTVAEISNGSAFVQGFNVPRSDYSPTPFTLTETMNGETETFSGYFVAPVPEPSTLLLMGTGVLAWLKRR